MEPKLNRWAERKGRTVKWGNVVMGMCGQQFEETFASVEEAKERERQALACEPIGNRLPIPIERKAIR